MKNDKSSAKAISKRYDSHLLEKGEIDKISMTAKISFANPAYIVELSKTSPNVAAAHCKSAMSSLHSGFNRRKYELLGAVVQVTHDLLAVQGEWRAFCKNPFWSNFKRKPKNSARGQTKALRLMMRFVFDAKTKNEVNVTNRYAKMLEVEYNTGVAANKIADIIEQYRGIEGMRKARAGDRSRERLKRQQKKHEQWEKDLKKDLADLSDNDNCRGNNKETRRNFAISQKDYKSIVLALEQFHKSSAKYFKSVIQ